MKQKKIAFSGYLENACSLITLNSDTGFESILRIVEPSFACSNYFSDCETRRRGTGEGGSKVEILSEPPSDLKKKN